MANVIFAKGSASISINPLETEARLVFEPDPQGDGWDVAAVLKLAADQHLTAIADQKTIETFLSKASRAKESMDLTICRGLEPENPVGEKVKWEALPIPGDMVVFKEETLANANAPKIFRTKIEKIKHEKKITKSGALPFMPAKEEIAVTWEKKETREEVIVTPEIRDTKYADKGIKVGTIIPATPGKPGKNIFGKLVHPLATGEETCLFGDGIVREKLELVAGFSGFIRIGENWADMVPLSKHAYSINMGIDGLTPFFHFVPGDPRFTSPGGEEILAEAASKCGDKGSFISAAELDKAIADSIKTCEPLEAFSLFKTQEAEVRVDINPDKTVAILYLRKGVAGALPLEMKAISQAIKESGVHAFNAEQLKTAIHAFMDSKELELADYVLAEGTPSSRGMDREVQILVNLIPAEEQKPVIERLEEWNNRNIQREDDFILQKATGFAFVEKDEVIARVSAGSGGEAGKDIFGNVIPGLPGNDPEIKLFSGLLLHGSDIVASESGLLLLEAQEKSFRGKIIEYRDAKIKVNFSDDKMEANADFYREEGLGIPLTVEYTGSVLAELGIKRGINWEEVENACAEARAKGKAVAHIIARGEPPIAKGGKAVKWLLHLSPPMHSAASGEPGDSEDSQPVTQDSGTEGGAIQVKAGIPILELSEPFAEGRSGYDVQGNEIPINSGTSQTIDYDDSVREEKLKTGRRLIAARSGELVFDGKELRISSVKIVEGNAGSSDENINFSGEIRINGNVLPGCVVIGGSHVIVNGLVEEALISAGGKVVAKRGIKGGGKGVIRARAGIESAFSERGLIMAIGDIHLEKGSILSTIKTNGRLFIKAENGKLSGGVYQARRGINAADIGSEKGIRTEISFGQDYVIKDQIGVCEEDIVKLRRKITELEEKIKVLLQKKIPLTNEVRQEKIRLIKILEQLNLKVFTLREKFEEHYDSEIRIRGTVFPGVVIESHDRYYEVKQKRSSVVFYFDRDSGGIKEKSLQRAVSSKQ